MVDTAVRGAHVVEVGLVGGVWCMRMIVVWADSGIEFRALDFAALLYFSVSSLCHGMALPVEHLRIADMAFCLKVFSHALRYPSWFPSSPASILSVDTAYERT